MDKERILFRITLVNRKRPLWWLVLYTYSTPSPTDRELIVSELVPELVPEPALDEPAPVEDIDFLYIVPAKKSKKKKVFVP